MEDFVYRAGSNGGSLTAAGLLATFDPYGQINPRSFCVPYLGQAIDFRLYGKSAGDMPVFSSFVHSPPNYIRSTTCWAAGIDLCSASVWNSHTQHQGAGT